MTVHERAGTARFVDPQTVETESGLRLHADKFILCAGGTSRRLPVPGFELTATHSDAWSLTEVPSSMLVLGGGATGVQVASIFNAFGTRVQLFQASSRILPAEDYDVSTAVTAAFARPASQCTRASARRVVRGDAGWCANDLLEGWRTAQRGGGDRRRRRWLGRRYRRARPGSGGRRDRRAWLRARRLALSNSRRTSSPQATSRAG